MNKRKNKLLENLAKFEVFTTFSICSFVWPNTCAAWGGGGRGKRRQRGTKPDMDKGISQNQTDEMGAHKVQLVIPRQIHSSFSVGQQCQLMTLDDFVGLVRERQNH